MRERSEAEVETYKRIEKGGGESGWCCRGAAPTVTLAGVVVVLPLLLLLPLWWPPMALVVVGGAAVTTVVCVGVTPLPSPSWSPLVVVGGAHAAVIVIVAVVVSGGNPHCCHCLVRLPLSLSLLVVVGAPAAITTVICGGVAAAVAIVVGVWWLVIRGSAGDIPSYVVRYLWSGEEEVSNKKVGERRGTYCCRHHHTLLPVVLRLAIIKNPVGVGDVPCGCPAHCPLCPCHCCPHHRHHHCCCCCHIGGGGGSVMVRLWMLWLLFWVCWGEAVCHVIDVGTCCPNLCKQRWAVAQQLSTCLLWLWRSGVRIHKITKFFCTKSN